MKRIELVGGPCDGQTLRVPDRIGVVALPYPCDNCEGGMANYSVRSKTGRKRLHHDQHACACGEVTA